MPDFRYLSLLFGRQETNEERLGPGGQEGSKSTDVDEKQDNIT